MELSEHSVYAFSTIINIAMALCKVFIPIYTLTSIVWDSFFPVFSPTLDFLYLSNVLFSSGLKQNFIVSFGFHRFLMKSNNFTYLLPLQISSSMVTCSYILSTFLLSFLSFSFRFVAHIYIFKACDYWSVIYVANIFCFSSFNFVIYLFFSISF